MTLTCGDSLAHSPFNGPNVTIPQVSAFEATVADGACLRLVSERHEVALIEAAFHKSHPVERLNTWDDYGMRRPGRNKVSLLSGSPPARGEFRSGSRARMKSTCSPASVELHIGCRNYWSAETFCLGPHPDASMCSNARPESRARCDGGTVMAGGAGLASLSRQHWSDL